MFHLPNPHYFKNIYLSLCIDTHVDAFRRQKRALDPLEVEVTGDYKLPSVGAGT